MRKYGKYEKRPEGVREKQPKVKSALLQTYFASLMCLVLCVTMFFGTSYAWFTSEVENTGNEIYVGTLAVDLNKKADDGTDISLSTKNDSGINENLLFDSNIRWEPGYTAMETITVVNKGDLAFKYVLNFTDGKIVNDEDREVADVAKFFDVWVYDYRANEGKTEAISNPDAYTEISKEHGWEPVGTLAELLEGKAVLDGVMVTVRGQTNEDAADVGPNDSVATEDTYIIALHMNEAATTDVMGYKIGLNVKLIAYQMSSNQEKDDFGNSTYDQMVASVDELKTALEKGGTTALATNIEINKDADCVIMANSGILDGNKNTLAYVVDAEQTKNSNGVLTTAGGEIKNLTITGNEVNALYISELTDNLTVSNSVLSGKNAFVLDSNADIKDYTIRFVNTKFESDVSFAKPVTFDSCIFADELHASASAVLTNCTFGEITGVTLTLSVDGEGNVVAECTSGHIVTVTNGVVAVSESET